MGNSTSSTSPFRCSRDARHRNSTGTTCPTYWADSECAASRETRLVRIFSNKVGCTFARSETTEIVELRSEPPKTPLSSCEWEMKTRFKQKEIFWNVQINRAGFQFSINSKAPGPQTVFRKCRYWSSSSVLLDFRALHVEIPGAMILEHSAIATMAEETITIIQVGARPELHLGGNSILLISIMNMYALRDPQIRFTIANAPSIGLCEDCEQHCVGHRSSKYCQRKMRNRPDVVNRTIHRPWRHFAGSRECWQKLSDRNSARRCNLWRFPSFEREKNNMQVTWVLREHLGLQQDPCSRDNSKISSILSPHSWTYLKSTEAIGIVRWLCENSRMEGWNQ